MKIVLSNRSIDNDSEVIKQIYAYKYSEFASVILSFLQVQFKMKRTSGGHFEFLNNTSYDTE